MTYKDDTPQHTICKIKQILGDLGIMTREETFEKSGVCYSCRIVLDNNGLQSLNLGTNGKGMTLDYALASGYAELMERLQNKFLVNEAMRHSSKLPNGQPLAFRFFPDEKVIKSSVDDFFKIINDVFPNYHSSEKHRQCLEAIKSKVNVAEELETSGQYPPQMEWLSVPFAKVCRKGKEIVNIPIILARANSSTGLCAGNTPQEAILQGINEIFERYVLQQLYLKNITPPSFPKGYFKETNVGKRLSDLENEGYLYDVKDMSLGKNFPVVGLVLTNTQNGTTMFRLGADISAEIALERCLTEIYQGRTDESKFLDYTFNYLYEIENVAHLWRQEYKKSLKDGTGFFPKNVFMGKPSYSFQIPSWYRTGDSKADLQNMLRYLNNNDYTLLVRDNSFLGFCTYHVMIPGLSDQDYRLRDIFTEYFSPFDIDEGNNKGISRERDANSWPLYHVKAQKDCRSFVEEHYSCDDYIRLSPYNTALQNTVNKQMLQFLMSVRNRDYKNAIKYFSKFMSKRVSEGYSYDSYLACVGSYVSCKSEGMTDEEMMSWLSHFYKQETIAEVMSDFFHPEDIMRNYAFPTCFNCDICPLTSTCHYSDAIAFERLMQQTQLSHPIDQNKLLKLLML